MITITTQIGEYKLYDSEMFHARVGIYGLGKNLIITESYLQVYHT